MYRQPTPREVLGTTAAEIGKHLQASRCLVAVGAPGEGAPATAEYFAPGLSGVGAGKISTIAGMVAKVAPDSLGGVELQAATLPALRDLGLESALGVMLTDKETQAPSGALLIGDVRARRWKPNESFFLQAVGDQLVLSVNHTRLRSLVRSLAVADEKTGLLSRGAYIDCLLVESNRARAQNTPISLIVLHVDRGGELLRQHGDAALDHYIEQLARGLSSAIRQTDVAVKYTAWSLVFILPDTSLENARSLAEKLRQTAASVRPSWGTPELTISAVVAEASSRPGDETEDRVTEWINRADAGWKMRGSAAGIHWWRWEHPDRTVRSVSVCMKHPCARNDSRAFRSTVCEPNAANSRHLRGAPKPGLFGYHTRGKIRNLITGKLWLTIICCSK